MANCDMCGKISDRLVKVKVENSMMSVCANCKQYGTQVEKTKGKFFANAFGFNKKSKGSSDVEEYIDPQYGKIIKSARESRKIKPEDFAKKLNEKESILLKVESGNQKPSFALAKKLENFLNIKLVQTRSVTKIRAEYNNQQSEEKTGGNLTFGDVLKNALKKK